MFKGFWLKEKIITITLSAIFLCAFSNVSFATLPRLLVNNTTGYEGDVVNVEIRFTPGNEGPVSALKFNISYNKDLVEAGEPIPGYPLESNHVQFSNGGGKSGSLEVVIVPAKQKKYISGGTLLQIPFRLIRAGVTPVSFNSVVLSDEVAVSWGALTPGNITVLAKDTDGDGIPDSEDVFPLDPYEQYDTDGDGIGDNADTDDDNDGVLDANDAFKNNPSESVDSDGDNIGDNADPDDDNDGMPDVWEIKYGLNPLAASDASLDKDSDGLSNLQEYQYGTDPTNPDTDGDGVSDGDEVAAGTDPTVNIPALMSIIQNLLLN